LNYNVYNQKIIRDMKTRIAEPELENKVTTIEV
jgi:hypothetical protein